MRALVVVVLGIVGAIVVAAISTISAIAAASVVVVVAAAALTLCRAIASPLACLAESIEQGAEPRSASRLRDAARLEAGVRRLVAEVRSREREAAAETERFLRSELAAAQQSAASSEARLGGLAPIAEALARLARGDLTVPIADARETHPLQSKLDQAVSLIAKTVLAFSASLEAIRDGAAQMNASVEAYGDEIATGTARADAALSALAKRSETTAELAAPLGASAALFKAFVDDAALQGAGIRRGCATFGEIRQAALEIAPILALVDEVAFQTNMLALNAGVEAARVGDAGRGMGVVAQELRLLAQRAAQAAKESSALLSRVEADAERGASELSKVESVHVAFPDRAAKILAVLERTGLELADGKTCRDALRAVSDTFAQAASARRRTQQQMDEETEALESLIGKLAALTGRFKLESDASFGCSPTRAKSASVGLRALPPPAPRRGPPTQRRQNSS